MRDGSSQMRLRYGAGRLIVRLRLAMHAYPPTTVYHSNPSVTLWHTIWNITRTYSLETAIYAKPHLHPLPRAILREQQVVCSYDGRILELCPHITATNKRGD